MNKVAMFTALFVAVPSVIGAGIGWRIATKPPPVVVVGCRYDQRGVHPDACDVRGSLSVQLYDRLAAELTAPQVEDIKDRPPAIIPLVDLTEGYLWDLPPPLVVAAPVVVDPVAFAPESIPAPVRHRERVWAWSSFEWPETGGVPYRGDPIPEPSTWAMMIAGFGTIGALMRRRRAT